MNDRTDVAKKDQLRSRPSRPVRTHPPNPSEPVRRGVLEANDIDSSTKTGVNGNFVLCKHIECNGLFGLLKDFCSEKTFFVDA